MYEVVRHLSFAILGDLCGYILTAKAAKKRQGVFEMSAGQISVFEINVNNVASLEDDGLAPGKLAGRPELDGISAAWNILDRKQSLIIGNREVRIFENQDRGIHV